jgi:hypothetical protein
MLMTRLIIFLLAFGFTAPVLAADDFGPRFDNQTPSALSLDQSAEALQNIEPAAGEDEDSAADVVERPAAQDTPVFGAGAVSVDGTEVVYE